MVIPRIGHALMCAGGLKVQPRSQSDAQRLGCDRYFTGQPCRHGHIAPRYTSTTNCLRCQVEHARRRGGWTARPTPEAYLEIARKVAKKKGGAVLSTKYVSARSKIR